MGILVDSNVVYGDSGESQGAAPVCRLRKGDLKQNKVRAWRASERAGESERVEEGIDG